MSGIITAGHVSVTRLVIHSHAPLEAWAEAMAAARYTGDVGEAGWGSMTDDTDRLGLRHRNRPQGGTPQVIDSGSRFPRRLEARLYFDRPDDRLIRQLDQEVEAWISHQLQAIDVVMMERGDSTAEALVSTVDDRDISSLVMPMLEVAAVQATGAPCRITSTDQKFDSDCYLWMIERANRSPSLGADLTLVRVRSMVTEDTLYRRTRYHEEAALDRLELLAAISNRTTRYGPAKLNFTHKSLGVEGDIELRPNGGYSVFVGTSYYMYRDIGRERLGRQLVLDTANVVIPTIRAEYFNDEDWNARRRAALMHESADLLSKASAKSLRTARSTAANGAARGEPELFSPDATDSRRAAQK